MERYIVREPRVADYKPNSLSANQMITSTEGNNERNDNSMFIERPLRRSNFAHSVPLYVPYPPANKQDFGIVHIDSPGYMVNCLPSGQRPMLSGIDPRYLAAYADPNANYIATGQIQREIAHMSPNTALHGDYQNQMPAERNLVQTFTAAECAQESTIILDPPKPFNTRNNTQAHWQAVNSKGSQAPTSNIMQPPIQYPKENNNSQNNCQSVNTTPTKKIEAPDAHRSEFQNQIMSRADKLKALHRSGARVFSGPVEKVLKWHKALQDIGVYALYEIVAKCVSIRPGEPCAKNLVVRDESGPAMQIVYYEVDFLLPELKPPCTVRIIGRMMAGTSRFQAFNVRSATGDDVATLPRRAAVAAHHVAKICKEYAV